MNFINTIWRCITNSGSARDVHGSLAQPGPQSLSRTWRRYGLATRDKRNNHSSLSPHEGTVKNRVSPSSEKDAYTVNRTTDQRDSPAVTSTVLVVDDEQSIRELISAQLSGNGRQVLLASDGQEALEVFRRERPDLTILDLHMPGMPGMEVLRKIRTMDSQAMVTIFAGSYSEDSIREARELGVREFLEKGSSAAWADRRRRL